MELFYEQIEMVMAYWHPPEYVTALKHDHADWSHAQYTVVCNQAWTEHGRLQCWV